MVPRLALVHVDRFSPVHWAGVVKKAAVRVSPELAETIMTVPPLV